MIAQLDQVIRSLARLPGVGRRSAERMAVKLVQDKDRLLPDVQKALKIIEEKICCCTLCGSITSLERNPCSICLDATRDPILCVVETAADIASLEESGGFRGYYHALAGKLSPMNGQSIHDLRTEMLLRRIQNGSFREVIIALNADMESDATAAMLLEKLRNTDMAISRIAQGIPVGSAVGYVDGLTLSRALRSRFECN